MSSNRSSLYLRPSTTLMPAEQAIPAGYAHHDDLLRSLQGRLQTR